MSKPAAAGRLGILLSGRGSNFMAIHRAVQEGHLQAEIALVFSNHAGAPGLEYARLHGLPVAHLDKAGFENRRAFDAALVEILRAHGVNLVVLAGYDRILSPVLLEAYPRRVLNIHPSLLPAYGGKGMVGMRVHQAVVAAGERESGCSVHIVTEAVDEGPVLGQARVTLDPADTAELVAAKVLAEEHKLYPVVIQRFIETQFASGEESHAAIET